MQNLSLETLDHLADIACEAAVSAGKLIQAYTGSEVAVSRKEGGDSLASQVVTEVDERSQALILERVRATRAQYKLGLLTEELSDDGSRFEKDYFWCIDPLDGTLPRHLLHHRYWQSPRNPKRSHSLTEALVL